MGNIYVTGANGFIGKHLMKALLDAITVDPKEACCHAPDDTVIHLANRKAKTFGEYMENVRSMGMLTKSVDGGKIVYVSSSAVYTNASLYGASKRACEQLCHCYKDMLDVHIVRPYNVYGPGQPDEFVIPTIINQFLDGKDMIVVKNVMASRVFTYVDDVVNKLIDALPGTYDIPGYSVDIAHLITLIADIMDRTGQYKICTELTSGDNGPGCSDHTGAAIGLREGLEKTIEYYKQLRLEKVAV